MESYVTLQTSETAVYESLLSFYVNLGFKVVAAEGYSGSGQNVTTLVSEITTTTKAVRVAWLSYFGSKNQTLSLLVKQVAPVGHVTPIDLQKTWDGLAQGTLSVMVLHADSLTSVKSRLGSLKSVDALVKDDLVSITVLDPLGNAIQFTSDPIPFLDKISKAKILSKTAPVPVVASSKKSKSAGKEHAIPAGAHAFRSKSKRNKKIGILTSGGDSSGMNAAVRSITRVALQRGCQPFAVYEGFQGLVDGGAKIKPLGWEDVRGFLSVGGTKIGTARCMEFRSREGRLKATFNMIKNGMDALVVIGGDGSLTGADILRSEWPGLVDELVDDGKLTVDESCHLRDDLAIVGLVGSIDNDMSLTDITIGAVTSLHRICEAVDSLTSTASSHQRAFVIEVMGRHCGWLGLMAGIAVGADWVCLPERPPPLDNSKYGDDWETEMCETVRQYRAMGSRKSLVIVCEGAIDRNLNPIKSEAVRKALETKLGLDTRVTTLGHIQRGGTPCAYDRYLATVQGVEAVEAVLRSSSDIPAPMIGMSQNKVTCVPLVDAVKVTHSVAKAIADRDFAKAMDLRDPDFAAAYQAYIESTLQGVSGYPALPQDQRLRIGIIHCGAPAGGMNAATRVAGRLCINRGHSFIGIRNGFSGLVNDEVSPIKWQDMVGWQVRGGSELGTNRSHPKPIPGLSPPLPSKAAESFVDMGEIAFHLQKHGIDALMIVGGFEAMTSLVTMSNARSLYPAFCIPMVHLPATVSNNVPGTEYSIGCDTALNVIVDACDTIKLSANASRKRVFVVEVQGGNCGYLATLGALITGSTVAYIPEDGITLAMLQEDINHICRRYREEDAIHISNEGRLVLRSENTLPEVFDTATISGIFRAESKGMFDSRMDVLGHLQQGGVPSPLDRIRATRLAVNCIDWIQDVAKTIRQSRQETNDVNVNSVPLYTRNPEHCTTVGIRGAKVIFSSVAKVFEEETDIQARRGKTAWWRNYKDLIRVLAKYEYFE